MSTTSETKRESEMRATAEAALLGLRRELDETSAPAAPIHVLANCFGSRAVLAYAGGKVVRHRIRILAGDRVSLEISPYDLTRGRISFRHKDEKPVAAPVRKPPFRGKR